MKALTIRDMTAHDIAPFLADLCEADRAELVAAGITDASSMLHRSLSSCSWAEYWEADGKPVAIGGVVPAGEFGIPWMLTTRHAETVDRSAMTRAALRAVHKMMREHSTLQNWIHASNARAIRFVQWLGFDVEPALCGPGDAFHFFHWRQPCVTP